MVREAKMHAALGGRAGLSNKALGALLILAVQPQLSGAVNTMEGVQQATSVNSATVSRRAHLLERAASRSQAQTHTEKESSKSWWWPFSSGEDDDIAVDAAESALAPLGSTPSNGQAPDVVGDDLAGEDEALPPTQRPANQVKPFRRHLSAFAAKANMQPLIIPDAPQRVHRVPGKVAPEAAGFVDEFDVANPDGDNPRLRSRPADVPHRTQALAATQSTVRTKAMAEEAEENMKRTPQEKQMAQCIKFAKWAKSNHLEGTQLIIAWKSTCTPAVQAGITDSRYAVMCEALGGAIEEFADQPTWSPELACTKVVRVFRESGVGQSPATG